MRRPSGFTGARSVRGHFMTWRATTVCTCSVCPIVPCDCFDEFSLLASSDAPPASAWLEGGVAGWPSGFSAARSVRGHLATLRATTVRLVGGVSKLPWCLACARCFGCWITFFPGPCGTHPAYPQQRCVGIGWRLGLAGPLADVFPLRPFCISCKSL